MYKFDTTWIAIAAGMLFSLMVSWAISEAQLESAKESFRAEVFQHATALGREFDLNAETLFVLKGLFEGSDNVTPEEFRRTASDSINRHRDIDALAWLPKVPHESRESIISERQGDAEQFQFIEMDAGNPKVATDREVYHPVYFVEPMTGNEQLLGLDMGANAAVRKMIENAGDGDLLTTTSALEFLRPGYPAGTVMMAVPVYQGMPVTIEDRHSQFLGVVVALMSVNAMVHEGLGMHSHTWIQNTLIVDRTDPANETILFQQGDLLGEYTIRRSIDQVSTSSWVVQASPVTGLLTGLQQLVSSSIGLVGILLFTALGFLHAGVQNRSRIISARVKERTRELNEANEKLAHLSSTDQLTGVDNRREMDRHLHQEWQRMAREKQPLSMMMIDVDMFKAFNDNYGHQAGDKCLVKIVQALQGQLKRATDRLARYGGEEFVIILSNTGDDAAGLAEECRQAVEAARIDHAYSAVSDRITISIGLATIVPGPSYSSDRLIAAADNAVYLAKQQGRNRVVIAEKVEIEPESEPEPEPDTNTAQ